MGDAEGQRVDTEEQRTGAGGSKATQRPGGLTQSFRDRWRDLHGADLLNIWFRREGLLPDRYLCWVSQFGTLVVLKKAN